VAEEIMPEAMIKTVQVKEMLVRGEFHTVHDAVNHVGLSRSGFYKYRDLVFLHDDERQERLMTITLWLEHRSGILSLVLNTIAQTGGNIITITQGIPLSQAAHVTATIDTRHLNISTDEMITLLEDLHGVRKVEIVGYS
jgi:chorismate mutase